VDKCFTSKFGTFQHFPWSLQVAYLNRLEQDLILRLVTPSLNSCCGTGAVGFRIVRVVMEIYGTKGRSWGTTSPSKPAPEDDCVAILHGYGSLANARQISQPSQFDRRMTQPRLTMLSG